MFKLEGKVALITGGASGIGLSTVKELLANGLKAITVVDFNETAGQRVIEEVTEEFGANRAIFVKADVGNVTEFRGAFEATVEKFDNLDIVINNAGIMNEIEWEKMINTNINGTIHGNLLALEYLQRKSSSEGVIINVASVAGLRIAGYNPIYTATKFAIVAASCSLSMEKNSNVRIITVCPGPTETPIMENVKSKFSENQVEVFATVVKGYRFQSSSHVSKQISAIIESGMNGSMWVIEKGEPAYKIRMPQYEKLRHL
ncbi:15-hydroxyprostaglandin dehydrogenase [NAD(+)]-like [Photinus pyralis]|nr:15-hydroxyprostaglandin dehydrogenase [NAD(+)]-like [Photinus pyralis]XP_031349159.1 15-hydroxyprostaglandin dehydrogenase [NAD(+)]-like [Photinus pyralis]